MSVSETAYAVTHDGARVAFRVAGAGPRDILLVPDWSVSVDLLWDHPLVARFLDRLSSLGRLIVFDKRASGASDDAPVAGIPGFEIIADDIEAVMRTVASRRADVVTTGMGSPVGLFFAATHPNRVGRLVVMDGTARVMQGPDYPHGMDTATLARAREFVRAHHGRGTGLPVMAPSLAGDEDFRRWWARSERLSLTHATMCWMWDTVDRIDVRPLLSAIQAPTLILHREGGVSVPVRHGRHLAAHIPDARLVELPGSDYLFFAGDQDRILGEIAAFLGAAVDPGTTERVLATVVFTDIVESTRRAAELGDEAWRLLLDRHDRELTDRIHKHRGCVVKSTGDGVLATFDGPARAVRCAGELHRAAGDLGVTIRIGAHTGEVELRDRDIAGLAVHVASRVAALAGTGQTLVTRTVHDLALGSGLGFTPVGTHDLRGAPGSWELFEPAAAD